MKITEKSSNRLQSTLLEIQKLPKSKGRRYSEQHQSIVKEAFRTGVKCHYILNLRPSYFAR